ncbi:MAG: hypothetical protein RIM23_18965 [Coleofasciculus sp. G3-WIS-01]
MISDFHGMWRNVSRDVAGNVSTTFWLQPDVTKPAQTRHGASLQ